MPGGTLTLRYGSTTIDFGTVTHIGPTYYKQVSATPLVSLPMESTFAVETASGLDIQVSFIRTGSDNGPWYNRLEAAVNRWQCKTNGFKMDFIPDKDTPYIPEFRGVNGYIKSLSLSYEKGENEYIKGTMEFHVGTMYVLGSSSSASGGTKASAFRVFIDDKRGQPCLILGRSGSQDINCIKSYTLTGGLEQPFEYLTLNIPKNKLASLYPALTEEGGIVAGKTVVRVSAVGTAPSTIQMTVARCKLSGDVYSITAYAFSEKLRGYTLQGPLRYTPANMIRQILGSGRYGVTYTGSKLVMACDEGSEHLLNFKEGTNVWYVLQVCAILLGARIFFSGDTAYVVDYRSRNSAVEYWGSTIDLYGDGDMRGRIVGQVRLGDEGVDTIVNKQSIVYSQEVVPEDGGDIYTEERRSDPFGDEGSIAVFKEKEGNLMTIPELVASAYVTVRFFDKNGIVQTTLTQSVVKGKTVDQDPLKAWLATQPVEEGKEPVTEPSQYWTTFDFGMAVEEDYDVYTTYHVPKGVSSMVSDFAENFISYRSEPQQSIEFTIKEMYDGSDGPAWKPYFSPCSAASRIVDTVDDVVVSNESDIDSSRTPVYQKLTLSTYEYRYPEGTATYTWGVMANIDLSTSTSQINNSLNSR